MHEKRLTQADLARIGNTTRQNVANYINNLSKPNYEFLVKLNTELDINLNWFIADTGNMYISTPSEALKEELRAEFEELLRKRGL